MKNSLFFFGLLLSSNLFAQPIVEAKKTHPLIIGEVLEIHSDVLNENRVLNVYLPNDYSQDSIKNYPVIYLLDGSIDEDIIHIAGLVQFNSFSWINRVPESIVVGISNIDRKRDYTFPTTVLDDKKSFPTTGGSAAFIEFLEKEVQPFIKANYKVNQTRTLIGQSLGGLLATEILFKKPEMFDNYIIVSPSLWWDKQSLLAQNPVVPISEKSVYSAVGNEGSVMQKTAKQLYNKLHKLDNYRVYFEDFKQLDHGDALHLAVYDAFSKIFVREEK
jgi:predicted alpha/beta superfamily hydrolase